jgi:hypothetical protein
MRLGKEQATGYVEDIGADMVPAEEIKAEQPERTPLTPDPEPALPVS